MFPMARSCWFWWSWDGGSSEWRVKNPRLCPDVVVWCGDVGNYFICNVTLIFVWLSLDCNYFMSYILVSFYFSLISLPCNLFLFIFFFFLNRMTLSLLYTTVHCSYRLRQLRFGCLTTRKIIRLVGLECCTGLILFMVLILKEN